MIADFIFIEFKNVDNKILTINKSSASIALKDIQGKLLIVQQAVDINGTLEIKIPPGVSKFLKIKFFLPNNCIIV